MKTVIAYVIVIVLSQFCLTAGAMFTMLFDLLFFWIHDRVRAPLCAFLAGVTGSVFAVSFAYLIFRWIVGSDSFGVLPFLAATIPLSIPIYNDLRKAGQLINIQKTLPASLHASTSPVTSGARFAALGELAGIGVAVLLFL